MPRNSKRTGIRNGNRRLGGPAPTPGRVVTKKFMYNEFVQMNNASGEYSYYGNVMKPDIKLAEGSIAQFAAFELWRLKRIRTSIQMAPGPSNVNNFSPINWVAGTTVWTAPDFGMNERSTGKEIMQYQNAKRTTPSLNSFKCVVDTQTRINASLGSSGDSSSYSTDFILPASTWVNTSKYNSAMYSGYHLFIQSPGFENTSPSVVPGFTLQTELTVEFMQPAFQAAPSSFGELCYNIKLQVIPDGNLPDEYRTYVFDRLIAERNADGEKEYQVRLVREDGQLGSLTYTGEELQSVWAEGTSGQYFSNRRAIYSGPEPEMYLTAERL